MARRTAAAPEAPAPEASGETPIPDAIPLATSRMIRDVDLAEAFRTWRDAVTQGGAEEAEKAFEALLALKAEAGAESLEVLGVAALRLARARLEQGDSLQAVSVTQGALALAPRVPDVHFGAARLFLSADASNPGRALSAALGGVKVLWNSAGATRGWVNLGAVVLLALVGTALVGVGLLFLGAARRFFHDFHHLFPSVAASWQSATLAVLLLSLPVVLRWGMLPALIVLALAVSMSLAFRERLVAAVLLALLGLVPFGAGLLLDSSAFLGTPAADVALLVQGGSTAEHAAARVEARRSAGRANATELLALGTFQGRRGALTRAEATLREAGALAPGDARIMTALGNVRFGRGDSEGALKLYQDATNASGTLADPHLNLAALHERRAKRLDVAEALRERNRADQARAQAIILDPTLGERLQPAHPMLNHLVRWPVPERAELLALADGGSVGEGIGQQTAALVGGRADPLRSALLGILGALAVLGLGALRGPLKASTPCAKCHGEACRRCDPGLVVAKGVCSQCNNAFGKRGVVPPQQRARKQLEIERQRARRHRVASTLGMLVSGSGHLMSGAPLLGISATFFFLVGVVGIILYRGVLRPVFGPVDAAMMTLLPLLPVLLTFHLWTMRSLRRRLAEER
ncbi:MAG TPA: hypothetical protein VK013_12245 [Myxococcaceae bacterium]|nr:hypothetical protein [Myxococcaceae bacterium]